MSDRIRTRIVRDLDDPERPEARVFAVGDLVAVECFLLGRPAESVLLQPAAAEYLIAALAIEAGRARAVANAAEAAERHLQGEC